MNVTKSGCALLAITLVACGCPRVDAFACGDGVSRCDLHEGGACVDGWCAYPDTVCDSGRRWHGDAPGVGGTCVPVDGGTEAASSSDPSSRGSPSSTSNGESSTGSIPSCGEELVVSVDTVALAGSEVLEGYPLLVRLEDPALVNVIAVGFTDLAGTPLPFELEAHDPDTGIVRAWVGLPAWTSGEPLDLLLRVGDPEGVPPEDPTAVWPEGFVGVWHFDDPLTGSARDRQLDSTLHANHGLVLGDMTSEQIVEGTIGGGIAFDGIDDEVQLAGASFIGALDSSTISLWARVDADGSVENPFFSRMNGDNLYPRCRTRPDTDGAVQCQTQVADVPLALRADAKLVPRGEWHHVAITFEAETGRFALHVNGALVDEDVLAAQPQDGGADVPEIGRIAEFGYLLGVLDELRVVDRPLPAAWLAADERSQRDPGAYARIAGAPLPTPCP